MCACVLSSSYLLVWGVLRLKLAADLLEAQVEVRKTVKQVNPPRRRIVHNGGHFHLNWNQAQCLAGLKSVSNVKDVSPDETMAAGCTQLARAGWSRAHWWRNPDPRVTVTVLSSNKPHARVCLTLWAVHFSRWSSLSLPQVAANANQTTTSYLFCYYASWARDIRASVHGKKVRVRRN